MVHLYKNGTSVNFIEIVQGYQIEYLSLQMSRCVESEL